MAASDGTVIISYCRLASSTAVTIQMQLRRHAGLRCLLDCHGPPQSGSIDTGYENKCTGTGPYLRGFYVFKPTRNYDENRFRSVFQSFHCNPDNQR